MYRLEQLRSQLQRELVYDLASAMEKPNLPSSNLMRMVAPSYYRIVIKLLCWHLGYLDQSSYNTIDSSVFLFCSLAN
jgi:hypothetical protein